MKHIPLMTTALLLTSGALQADVSLPKLFSDHMVLQRDRPIHVWGKASGGETVKVSFRGEERTALADEVGLWSLWLAPATAGGPYEMTVGAIRLTDILVGDVWVGSGQSNMEMPLRNVTDGAQEVAAAKFPRIRLFRVKNNVASYPLADVEAKGWTECTPESAADFSAAALFFARHVQKSTPIPIGLIESNWGGTPAEAWTSLRALATDASLMPVFAEWAKMNDGQAVNGLRREKQIKEWREEVERSKAAGKPEPGFPWQANDQGCWSPAGLFNAMIAPLTAYPIKGVIWYQGESNASRERAPVYAALFRTLIQDWRQAWGEGDFPFLFVQLANFKTGADARWPELREAQREALTLVNTGMAVAIDIGTPDDIHPKNKQEIGRRLALAAEALAYGKSAEYSGPLVRQTSQDGAGLRIWFDHAHGLKAKSGPLAGFEIAGPDGVYVPAEAKIDGDTVVVSSPSIPAPVSVRYDWSDNPNGNLYNAADLPASPFRSARS